MYILVGIGARLYDRPLPFMRPCSRPARRAPAQKNDADQVVWSSGGPWSGVSAFALS